MKVAGVGGDAFGALGASMWRSARERHVRSRAGAVLGLEYRLPWCACTLRLVCTAVC